MELSKILFKNRRSGNLVDMKTLMRQHEDNGEAVGLLYHYTDFDAFRSIVGDGQLRLTRFDKMKLAPDEGDQAIYDGLRYVRKCCRKHGISKEYQRIIRDAILSYSGLTVIRRIGCDPRVECIPYVICFTTLDMGEGWSRKTRSISCRDLRIRFLVADMGLDLPTFVFGKDLIEMNCNNAIQFVQMKYISLLSGAPDGMEDDIGRCFKELVSGSYSIEETANVIARIVCGYRVTRLKKKYRGQRESRLVFYVPLDMGRFPEVARYVRMRGGSEGYERGSEYVYVNFSDEMEMLFVDFNRKKGYTKKQYEDIIRDAGFRPSVSDIYDLRRQKRINH